MPDEISDTIQSYNTHAAFYAAHLGRVALDEALDWFATSVSDSAWVADIGAGPGRYTLELQRRQLRVVAVDLAGALIQAARASGVTRCVQADMLRLPFAAEALQGVWVCASLLHLPHTLMPGALRELRRAVKPSGVGYFAVKRGNGEEWVSSPDGGRRFFAYYQPESLDELLRAAGWRIESAHENPGATEKSHTWLVRWCHAE